MVAFGGDKLTDSTQKPTLLCFHAGLIFVDAAPDNVRAAGHRPKGAKGLRSSCGCTQLPTPQEGNPHARTSVSVRRFLFLLLFLASFLPCERGLHPRPLQSHGAGHPLIKAPESAEEGGQQHAVWRLPYTAVMTEPDHILQMGNQCVRLGCGVLQDTRHALELRTSNVSI